MHSSEDGRVNDPLLRWRVEFPTLARTTHMISHSLGAMPLRTRERLAQFADEWTERSIRAWSEGWWDMPVTVGDLIGKIIDAAPGSVVMHQNVSICQQIVLSALDWSGKRNRLVTESLNFPSNHYIFHHWPRYGARIVEVPSADGITVPLDALLGAIDEETLLVTVSHVTFRSSYLQDIAAIVEKAHRVGAMVLVDTYQSCGTVPFSVRGLNVDFATGGSVKWLCGGPGAAYLYVRPDLWPHLQPAATGWMAHKQPFEFVPGPIEFADDATRFLNGTPAIPALYAAMSGYEIVSEIGVPAIREKSQRQTQYLIARAEELGLAFNGVRNPKERGGVVIFDVPEGKAVTAELLRRNILVDYRPGAGIRIAPHFYTTDDELDYALDEIRSISNTLRSTVAH
jgi:kynureninase